MRSFATPPERDRVLAILGPTNTGKTHFAVERLLGHRDAMIGLPLRLLAREVYDRVVAVKGAAKVALVTGEEKVVPDGATHFVCTVESMPVGREFDFVAVDEIQLCADPERGHIFTDRLLHARGRHETLFMGSDSMRPLIQRLVPEAEFLSRPRLSSLSYAGPRKLSRLPRRSAIVAFSADDVYAVAELIRRQRGGAAVVMGALSPRTRNAQVAMYQAGDVDFIVATDAIGMGLNMAIDHVAFASLRKFDGQSPRHLTAAEIGQIAGRAGRHMNDGSFGVTADAAALPAELAVQVEEHQFPRIRTLSWRSTDLDFASIDRLLGSLDAVPETDCLVRPREPVDQMVLRTLSREQTIRDICTGTAAVRRLWQVCQIPDFRKTMPDAHARLLGRIYSQLMGPRGTLDTDWVAGHVAALDRTDGDIDTLASRIAHVRTWTFISHRQDWIDDARNWQARTRDIEDRLSDALHRCLTQRFVDRRTSVLLRRLRDSDAFTATVGPDGGVVVEDQFLGQIEGLRFIADRVDRGREARSFVSAARQSVTWELTRRAQMVVASDGTNLALTNQGKICWQGEPVAQLVAGDDLLRPRLDLLADDAIAQPLRDKVVERLQEWLRSRIGRELAPLYRLQQADLSGTARGIAFQIAEGLGSRPRHVLDEQIRMLSSDDRRRLRRAGLWLGQESVYLPAMLKPGAARMALLLWAVRENRTGRTPSPPAPGLVSVAADDTLPDGYYHAVGFRRIGPRAIRADMLERLSSALHRQGAGNSKALAAIAETPELLSIIGCPREDFPAVMQALGYHPSLSDEGTQSFARVHPKSAAARRSRRRASVDDGSPFAVLRHLPLA